jgi:hypothetical protein
MMHSTFLTHLLRHGLRTGAMVGFVALLGCGSGTAPGPVTAATLAATRAEVDFGECDELALGTVVPLAALQAQVPAELAVLSLAAMGTVFEGSDGLGVLITRALSCESITVNGTTNRNIHIAHIGTPINTASLPATPYNLDGHNGAQFNNYTFRYLTDSPALLAALTAHGVPGAGNATIEFTDTPAGDCTIRREVVVRDSTHGFRASGTVPAARCQANETPYVGNSCGAASNIVALSNNIVGPAAVNLDLAATPIALDEDDASTLASWLGDAPKAVDAFGMIGFIPETAGLDMIITRLEQP